MDMPIRIIITLFVAMIVGTSIIMFAKQIIDKGREDLIQARPGVNPDDIDDEKIIHMNILDDQQLINLILECYDRHHGQSFERELCFVVIGKSGTWTYAGIQDYFSTSNEMNANTSITDEVLDNDYAVSLYYDPYGESESIEITK